MVLIKIIKKANNVNPSIITNNLNKIINIRSYSTINYNNFITPINNNIPIIKENISTMDIETMEYNGIQIPIAISLAYLNNVNKINSKYF